MKVFEKSGLNQWNAGGRTRNKSEVYIPIPNAIHNNFPNFFPSRNQSFFIKASEWRENEEQNLPRWRKSFNVSFQ